MHSNRLIAAAFTTIILFSFGAWATTESAVLEKPVLEGPHTAVYTLTELEPALAKQLVKALGETEGIMSAKPDYEENLFAVTFEPEKISTDKLTELLSETAPGIELEKLTPAEHAHAHTACGKCPLKAKCSKNK